MKKDFFKIAMNDIKDSNEYIKEKNKTTTISCGCFEKDIRIKTGSEQDDDGVFLAFPVDGKLIADALNGRGLNLFTKLLTGFPGAHGGAALHGAFDQFPGFQGIPGLLDHGFGNPFLADIEDDGQGIAHGTQLRPLLAG